MDERDASELLDGVERGLRAPGHVRDRAWREMVGTLRGDLPLQVPVETPEQLRVDESPGVAHESAMVLALNDAAADRRSRRIPVLVAAAAAVALIIGLAVIARDGGEPERVLVDVPANETLMDPDLACARFLESSIDTRVFLSGTIDPAELAGAEAAVARLRADFEAAADAEGLSKQLGEGSLDDLRRVEGLLRQARLQFEQDDPGAARTTLALIPNAAERLVTTASDSISCLGSPG